MGTKMGMEMRTRATEKGYKHEGSRVGHSKVWSGALYSGVGVEAKIIRQSIPGDL